MKKIVYIIVSFMFLLPCMVNAESYLNTKEIANKYILNTTYRGTYQRYLLTNTSNYYIGGETEGFDNGGLISYNEFLISQNGKSPMFSYLYDGYNYWTYTKSGDKRYIVSNTNDVEVNESDTTPKARVTQYVKSETRVEGSGTISDPWIFVPSYEVNITTNDYGSISIRKNNSCTEGSLIKEVDLTYIKGDTLDICIRPNNGYVYVSNDCASFLTLSSTKDYLTLKNITKDINCKIYFGKSSNKITLEQTGAEVTSLPTEIYLIYSQGWYKDKEATTQIVSLDRIPKRTGYSFDGYTHQNTDGTTLEIINSNGKVITNENTLNSFEREGSLKINWKAKTTSITLDNQGGSAESIDIVATYDSDMPTITTLPKRVGYKFEGYYYGTNGSGTIYYNADGTSANKWNVDSESATLYAKWKDITAKPIKVDSTTYSCPVNYTCSNGICNKDSKCIGTVTGTISIVYYCEHDNTYQNSETCIDKNNYTCPSGSQFNNADKNCYKYSQDYCDSGWSKIQNGVCRFHCGRFFAEKSAECFGKAKCGSSYSCVSTLGQKGVPLGGSSCITESYLYNCYIAASPKKYDGVLNYYCDVKDTYTTSQPSICSNTDTKDVIANPSVIYVCPTGYSTTDSPIIETSVCIKEE